MSRRGAGTPQVLVVGGGPVGVTLACELLRRGVDVRVVDSRRREVDTDPHSRGVLVWPRSLEILRGTGVSERLVAAGHRVPAVSYYSAGREKGTAWLDRTDTAYPFVLTLPQKRTEQVLRERLVELGGHVDGGVTLDRLDATDPDHPVAYLRHDDGSTETVRPTWLIGCDGPASEVRAALGIGFEGDPIDVTYAIGDMPLDGDVPVTAGYYYSDTGVVAVVPLGDGLYRLAANVAHRDDAAGDPAAAEFEQILLTRAGLDVRVGVPAWTRSFRPRMGLADGLRRGHCLLAGDAAHVISPAGGQGLNVGFQDAVNLGWRLAGVCAGRLHDAELDAYAEERHAAANRMSRTSAAQARFALQRSPWRIGARDLVFRTADRTGLLDRVLVPLLSQTDLDYGNGWSDWNLGRRVGPARAGQRLPVHAPLPEPAGGRFTATGPGAPTDPTAVVELDPDRRLVLVWAGTTDPHHRPGVDDVRAVVGDTAVVREVRSDVAAHAPLAARLGRDAVIAVVRPDGHLEARFAPTAHADLRRHLERTVPDRVRLTAVAA